MELESVEATGGFRIYLGAAAGVGKTVAMLDEAHRRAHRGTDVVIGLVETHRRPYTEEKSKGLEMVPPMQVEYRGASFVEMDVAAILARNPELVLVDELAHTNVPGSSAHAKRWEDVLELRRHGIKVISTLNVQHIESISDAVEKMTGVRVAERVPDWVVRSADQIELVDSSPEQLRRRIAHGNVYDAAKVHAALQGFFRQENLTALRELALRFVADETEEDMLSHLSKLGATGTWETRERIMVAVTGASSTDQIMHRAARIASRTKGTLYVVHVSPEDGQRKLPDEQLRLLEERAHDLSGEWIALHGDNVADTLLRFAIERHVTQIVVGATSEGRVTGIWRGSILQRLIRGAGNSGIDVHVIASTAKD